MLLTRQRISLYPICDSCCFLIEERWHCFSCKLIYSSFCQSLNRWTAILNPSFSFISVTFLFSPPLSYYIEPSFSTFIFPLLWPCCISFPFPLWDRWQQTEELCPPLPSEEPDPCWEMEMPRHWLTAHGVSWFFFPSVTLGTYEWKLQGCWHDKVMHAVPKAVAWLSERNWKL